jgi:choline dehydrogenase-like flavoprotein
VQGNKAVGVEVATKAGTRYTVRAKSEIILCTGAIDTPRLMLLSGLGPKKHLDSVKIPVVKDIAGVGENLQDHPSSVVVYDLHEPAPKKTATHSDVLAFLRHKPFNWAGDDGNIPDILLHMWALDLCDETSKQGYDRPKNPFCFLPVALRTRASGRLYLKSNDPSEMPALDFKYFEDSASYDAEVIVAGIKAARKMAESEPLKSHIRREVAPGPHMTSDEDLNKYARSVACTIYHPACTAKMGDVEKDPMAVVDSRLRVRGIQNLRIADASVFPIMISVNLMLTTLAVGERAAELIAEDAGWTGLSSRL